MMDVYRHLDPSYVQFDFAVVHDGEYFFDREVKERGANKYILPDPRKGLVKNYYALVKFFHEHREYKAVHAHLAWYSGIVLLAAKQAGIPIRIAHARDSKEQKRPLKTSVACRLGQLLINMSATQRIAVSEAAAENIFGRKAVEKGNYFFVPNSIDISKYRKPTKQEKTEIRDKLCIPACVTAFVCVANLRAQKNHIFLLDIASELKQQGDIFVLYLIGDGVLREQLQEKVSQLGLEENVVFMGSRKDVPEILGAFDAMVFPSLYEGLGGVVLEAQLVGIPSIVSDRIPDEADVGVGMVKRLSLDLSAEQWAKEVVQFTEEAHCTYEDTVRQFELRGYTISNTTKLYLKEYGVPEEIIKKAVLS